ncbi:MAG: cation:proton antiporter [Candidatus Paceibacterota bacterium]
MTQLLPFFVVLFAGLFFSEAFNRLHLPWVTALILGGILIGPFGLDFVEVDPILQFFSEVGLVFLMFMAGLETRLSSFSKSIKHVWVIALLGGVIPFIVGVGIGAWFDYSITTSLLLGITFISSSIAVVIPALEQTGILQRKIGHVIVSSTMLQDIASLVLLSIVFQATSPTTSLPLPIFYILSVGVLLFLRWALPRLQWFFHHPERDLFQQELRSVFAILIGTVILFELLGLHPIIAGFFAGLVLSESITSSTLKGKLRALSYGLFIPVFFITTGITTNVSILFDSTAGFLVLVVVVGLIISKIVSGWIGGVLLRFNTRDTWLISVTSIPQLSTTLAIVFSGVEFGFLDAKLSAALVILTIVTTFLSPLLFRMAFKMKMR